MCIFVRAEVVTTKYCIDNGITICNTYSMKTAISIPDELFKKIEKVAKEYNYSRSELFTIAAREFIEKINSKKLLDAINEAYSDVEMEEETSLRRKSKKYYASKILKEKY